MFAEWSYCGGMSKCLARRITRPIQKLRVYQQHRGAVGSGHRSCDIC
jgi:hypothetical protein